MGDSERPFFLLIGANDGDFSTNRIKVAGARYRRKSLYSSPDNWEKIVDALEDPHLTAVIGKMTGRVFNIMAHPGYADVSERLLSALSKRPNLMMIHDSMLREDTAFRDAPSFSADFEDMLAELDDDLAAIELRNRMGFDPHALAPDGAVWRNVLERLTRFGIILTPYTTHAEMVTLAGSFIDDHESNLLFRVYVPAGRLYASEADRLLALFHDWLTQVGHHSVRQDGYTTAAGRVYEFFGGEDLKRKEMTRYLSDFSSFLDLCVKDPDAAEIELSDRGLERGAASAIVTRYGRSVRRINTDLRHERETRMLSIRHRLESELLEIAEGDFIGDGTLDSLIENLIPGVSTLGPLAALAAPMGATGSTSPNVVINQQVFNNVQGSVVQNVQGVANLGSEAKDILELISEYGGSDSSALQTDVHELEDPDARQSERVGAKARLTGFLLRLVGSVEETALGALQKYVESKLGI